VHKQYLVEGGQVKQKGLIQIYTGDGKGKSTAAIGQAVRAAGHGFKVGFISFFKPPEIFGYGEYKPMGQIGIEVFHFAKKHPHFYKEVNSDQLREECLKGVEFVKELFKDECWDMLVLDELNIALRDGFLREEEVVSLLEAKPDKLELILTGRGATEEIIERADLVTEVKKVKHPYDQGVQGREGIEY
jgi:cob(I)alamin adenosyltransferase